VLSTFEANRFVVVVLRFCIFALISRALALVLEDFWLEILRLIDLLCIAIEKGTGLLSF